MTVRKNVLDESLLSGREHVIHTFIEAQYFLYRRDTLELGTLTMGFAFALEHAVTMSELVRSREIAVILALQKTQSVKKTFKADFQQDCKHNL